MITKLIALGLINSPQVNSDYTSHADRFEVNKRCVTDDEVTAIGVIYRYPYECLYTPSQQVHLGDLESKFVALRHANPPEGQEDFI